MTLTAIAEATNLSQTAVSRALRRAGYTLSAEEISFRKRFNGRFSHRKAETRKCRRCTRSFTTMEDYRMCSDCRKFAAEISPFEP